MERESPGAKEQRPASMLPMERHLSAAEAEAAQAESFAEWGAARLYSPGVTVADLVAAGEVLRPVPMERAQAPQKKASSKANHRRRRDPIRPCRS
jgi:hypothetical protein